MTSLRSVACKFDRLAHTNPLHISDICTPSNFIFQCYISQTWQFYLFFPLFPFLVFTKSLGRSRDPLLQKAYLAFVPDLYHLTLSFLRSFTGISLPGMYWWEKEKNARLLTLEWPGMLTQRKFTFDRQR